MLKEVTLKDLADRTGFSVNTVSRALRGKPDISKITREKVAEIAEELGYRRNALASQLRTRESKTLGLIVTDIVNPVYSGVTKGVETAAKREGYSVLLSDTEEDPENEAAAIHMMLEKRVDGMIIVPTQQHRESFLRLLERGFPFVVVGRIFDDIQTNCVVNDDVRGGFLAADHLIAKGHRKILFLGGFPHISSAAKRMRGYKQALELRGLPFVPELVVWGEPSMEGGYERLLALCTQSAREWTAVFCFNDLVAIGVMMALEELGMRIPDDVAVVGYDDIKFAPALRPPLTTVDIGKYRLGEKGAELLIALIKTEPARRVTKEIILEPRLVVRSST